MQQTLALRLSPVKTIAYPRAMPVCPDAQLMLDYAAGDLRAFERLYGNHKDALYRYALRLCGNAACAEDIAQEVWSKIIKNRARYRADAKFTTYLYRVAHNAFIDFTRRTRNQKLTDSFDPELNADPTSSPLASVESIALSKAFQAALGELPPDQRDAYLLHEEAGLTIEAIAEVTSVTRETAKSRIRYAVAKLKSALLESYQPDSERSA